MFNSEPGRPSGNIVTARKGGVFLRFEVFGKAAHSGGDFEKGISAIGELAHKIVAMHKLTDLKRGITVNVGLVEGRPVGQHHGAARRGPDRPALCQAGGSRRALASLQEIIDTATVPGTTAQARDQGRVSAALTTTGAAQELFAGYQAAAADAGLRIEGEFSGGCANSGFTAGVGCPTLCATGPVGANAHTREEYLEVGSWCRGPRPWRWRSCGCRRRRARRREALKRLRRRPPSF